MESYMMWLLLWGLPMFSHQRFFRTSYVSNFPNNCKDESLRVTENNNVLKFLGLRSFTYIFKKENNLVLLHKKLVHKQFQRIFDLLSNCLSLICYSSGGTLSEHGGVSRGVLNKVFNGEAPPWGPTSYPFKYHFYLPLTNVVADPDLQIKGGRPVI